MKCSGMIGKFRSIVSRKRGDTVGECKSAAVCVSYMPSLKAKSWGNLRKQKRSWNVDRGSPTVTHEPGLSTAYGNGGAISSRVSEGFLRHLSARLCHHFVPEKVVHTFADGVVSV